jgi:hypothetical protein
MGKVKGFMTGKTIEDANLFHGNLHLLFTDGTRAKIKGIVTHAEMGFGNTAAVQVGMQSDCDLPMQFCITNSSCKECKESRKEGTPKRRIHQKWVDMS